ncbi:MAG: universal stress protein [Thermodesulfobacteriota bacterium]|jgi:nucleotide-binding universal stress UspA family protein
MAQLEKIVVGYDFRAGGETAARSALALAQRCGAALRLVHVVEPYPLYQRLARPLAAPYSTEELVQRAGEKLEALATSAEYGSVRVEYEVRTGKPFVELIRARRAWQADLLVVGGTAKGEERWLGSTAEHVVQKAIVPVLVAKKSLKASAQTFLVPVDFSPSAKRAAEEAIVWAGHFGGQLRFVHALEPLPAYAFAGPELGGAAAVPVLTPDDVAGEWEAFLSDLPGLKSIRWDKATIEGPAVPTIVQAAEARQADLIIMGTNGRTGLAHMLLGSVAEGVVRTAACPVLTIRPDAFHFELPEH